MSKSPIGQIVRDAQETMARINQGSLWREFVSVIQSVAQLRDARYPQSLGELCLEAVADATRRCVITFCPYPVGLTDEARSHIHAIRRAMYHRNHA